MSLRRFDDLSEAEVLSLSDEQVRYYMDLECAEAGAPLLPPDPGVEPQKETFPKDREHFAVGGILFKNASDAQRVLELVNTLPRFKSDYARGGSYYEHIITAKDEPEVMGSSRDYSPEAWELVRADVTAQNQAKERWKAAKGEYDKAVEKRDEACAWVMGRVEAVRENERKRQQYAVELARYVELAKGDEDVARDFLLRAKPEANEYLPQRTVAA